MSEFNKVENATFFNFIAELNKILDENREIDGRPQKTLLNELFGLEKQFRDLLLSDKKHGTLVYKKFIDYMNNVKKNETSKYLLISRVYFREKQARSTQIYNAILNNKPESLYKFRINYRFIDWALKNYKGHKIKALINIYNEIVKIRHILVNNNLPLALNRAKIFWTHAVKPQHRHKDLDYMDFVQASAEGLLVAIDKFVPPYKKVFASTAIARMNNNMDEILNDSIVHIPQNEKRILKRAVKAQQKTNADLTSKKVLEYVSESFENVSPEKIQEIQAAAHRDVRSSYDPETAETNIFDTISANNEPEDNFLSYELEKLLYNNIENLDIIMRKVLSLKYGKLF
jgi:DNA-directed RNA polymerase specialized sigma subunit